ncbi:MAG: agmatinase family protein [Candidatus Melainabacteria bacterium]|jgi:agmatinase|nr:agmatinase family protein [Candidatus Melainabacteria bacterium]
MPFDPNSLAQKDSNIFGLPFTEQEAQIVIIPVPWEVTVSYNAGTAAGPDAIFEASSQVDLYDPVLADAWRIGVHMQKKDEVIQQLNDEMRPKAEEYIAMLEDGRSPEEDAHMRVLLGEINEACATMNHKVQSRAEALLKAQKIPCLVGGDHSTPLGLMRALRAKHPTFSILHIDAHADLRDAYEGFEYSHASIMFNALKEKHIDRIVQVGIRDYCQAEKELIDSSNGRVVTYFDRDLKSLVFDGKSFKQVCGEIVSHLSPDVYISFDIDGLDPRFCPNTGTPVPGGLDFDQVLYLFEQVVESGRRIIAFDLNEVAPGKESEWDANVGARAIYRLANLLAKSNGLAGLDLD